jgi:hypothetical protein
MPIQEQFRSPTDSKCFLLNVERLMLYLLGLPGLAFGGGDGGGGGGLAVGVFGQK